MSFPDPFYAPYTDTARSAAATQRFTHNNNPFYTKPNSNNCQPSSHPPQPHLLFNNRENPQPLRLRTQPNTPEALINDPPRELTTENEEPLDSKGLYSTGARKYLVSRSWYALATAFVLSWPATWVSGLLVMDSWSIETVVAMIRIFIGLGSLIFYRIRHMNVVRMVEPNLINEALRRMSPSFVLLCTCQIFSAYCIVTTFLDRNNVEDARKSYNYPEGRYGSAQLNPSYIFTLTFICAIAVAYAWDYVSSEKDTLKFPSITIKPTAAILSRMRGASMQGILFATKFSCVFATFWLFFGGLCFRFAEAFFGRILQIAIVNDPNAGFYSILPSFTVLNYTTLGAMLACMLWNALHDIIEVIFTQPMTQRSRSMSARDENDRLIAGLKMKKIPLQRHHAFLELYNLSETSPGRRSEIFKDLACTPTAWQRIFRECLYVVQELTDALSAEQPVVGRVDSKPDPFSSNRRMIDQSIPLNKIASAPTTLPQVSQQLDVPFSKLNGIRAVRSKKIFSPPRKPNNFALSAASDLISLFTSPTNASPPPIRHLKQPGQLNVSKGTTTKNQGNSGGWYVKLYGMAEKSALGKRILYGDPTLYQKMLFREVQLVVWAARAVSNLTTASFNEDPYGTIQRDVPEILDTLLTCISAVEDFARKHPMSGHGGPARGPGIGKGLGKGVNDGSHMNIPAPVVTQATLDVLQQCVYQIVVTFHEHLSEFKFSLPLKEKLQPFIEFRSGV